MIWLRSKIKTSFHFHCLPSNSFLVEVFLFPSFPRIPKDFAEEEKQALLQVGTKEGEGSFPRSNLSGFPTSRQARRGIHENPFPFNHCRVPQN